MAVTGAKPGAKPGKNPPKKEPNRIGFQGLGLSQKQKKAVRSTLRSSGGKSVNLSSLSKSMQKKVTVAKGIKVTKRPTSK